MEESIEERAIVIYPDEYNTSLYYDPDQDINIELRQAYIKGAVEQRAIDLDKAWQFIEVTIIREGHASEDFVEEMNWRFKQAMEE